jgi:hypothetical protein
MGEGRNSSTILDFGIDRGVVSCTFRPFYPMGKSPRYLLEVGLDAVE